MINCPGDINYSLDSYSTVQNSVIPAEAGIHNPLIFLDSRLRGNDGLVDMIFL
jgi:hypothetical protein